MPAYFHHRFLYSMISFHDESYFYNKRRNFRLRLGCCEVIIYQPKAGDDMSDFKWKHFRGDIILGCVRWYCKYGIFATMYYGPPSGRVSKGAWDRSEPTRDNRYISESIRKVDLDARSVSSI